MQISVLKSIDDIPLNPPSKGEFPPGAVPPLEEKGDVINYFNFIIMAILFSKNHNNNKEKYQLYVSFYFFPLSRIDTPFFIHSGIGLSLR